VESSGRKSLVFLVSARNIFYVRFNHFGAVKIPVKRILRFSVFAHRHHRWDIRFHWYSWVATIDFPGTGYVSANRGRQHYELAEVLPTGMWSGAIFDRPKSHVTSRAPANFMAGYVYPYTLSGGHINPFGRYHSDLTRMRQDGGQPVELPSEPSASERGGP
jgi:hypothetical protein